MLHQRDMFQRMREGGSFAEVPRTESSWRTRLSPGRAPAWPNPQDSVGKLCCNIGDQMFWEIKDPGRAKLAALEEDIQRFLNDQNEYLKERESSNVSFSLFMIGKHETLSCPTLVVISTNKSSRRRVVESIRYSRILDKYDGVLLAQSSRHPRYPKSGPAQYIVFGSEENLPLTYKSLEGVVVYMKKSTMVVGCGTLIYIPVDPVSEDWSRFRKATLGGILELTKSDSTKTIVGMTVAHAFQVENWDGYTSDESEASESESFEFEFDGPTPGDVFGDDRIRGYSRSSWKQNTGVSSHQSDSLHDTKITMEHGSRLTVLGILIKTALKSRQNLDWALIEITAKGLGISNAIPNRVGNQDIEPIQSFSTADKDITVATCTGSKGSKTGIMSGSSTFLKLKYGDTFEEVKTVNLHGTLSYGDSGSWVVEQDSGKLCGYMIAGDISTALAYIIPARVVFEHVERRYNCRLALPKHNYILSEDMSERLSQLQVSTSNLEKAPEATQKNAPSPSVRPSSYRDHRSHRHQNYYVTSEITPQAAPSGNPITPAMDFYSQGMASYQSPLVYPPPSMYGRPSAGYQEAKTRYQEARTRSQEAQAGYQEARARHMETDVIYEEALTRYQEAKTRYQKTQARYQEVQAKYPEARTEAEAIYQDAIAEYQEAEARCDEALARTKETHARYEEAKARYQEARARFREAMAGYNEAQARYLEYGRRYQEAQVYPSPSSYSQSPAGFQQPLQGSTSVKYHVGGSAPAPDPRISTTGVPVAQAPIVEANRQYGYPQDKKPLYSPSVPPGISVSTTESTDPQHPSQPMDPYYVEYDRAGRYTTQYPHDRQIYQKKSSSDRASSPEPEAIIVSPSAKHKVARKDRDHDLKKGKDRDNEISMQREVGHDFRF